MTLSIIGAGLGRTGTMSLKAALEMLGFGPCYHMIEVIQNPSFAESWERAADGKPVDWDQVFEGYRSTVDWPGCHFYRALADHYPEAKVILSVRDPEQWYDSVYNTIFQVLTRPLPHNDIMVGQRARMAKKIVLDQTFDGRFEDREHAVAVFKRHTEEVKRAIPADRLLIYEVTQGWEPLCRFLGRPVPAKPFPQTNSTDEFRQRFYL